jgi:hypothetical protein
MLGDEKFVPDSRCSFLQMIAITLPLYRQISQEDLAEAAKECKHENRTEFYRKEGAGITTRKHALSEYPTGKKSTKVNICCCFCCWIDCD